jgi:hypothetical protein
MNAKQFIAATAVFVAAGSAFAADAPAAATAAVANAVAANAVVASANTVLASNLNLPTVSITKSTGRARTDVHGEAVEFVKNHKTAFAVQLDQYKN